MRADVARRDGDARRASRRKPVALRQRTADARTSYSSRPWDSATHATAPVHGETAASKKPGGVFELAEAPGAPPPRKWRGAVSRGAARKPRASAPRQRRQGDRRDPARRSRGVSVRAPSPIRLVLRHACDVAPCCVARRILLRVVVASAAASDGVPAPSKPITPVSPRFCAVRATTARILCVSRAIGSPARGSRTRRPRTRAGSPAALRQRLLRLQACNPGARRSVLNVRTRVSATTTALAARSGAPRGCSIGGHERIGRVRARVPARGRGRDRPRSNPCPSASAPISPAASNRGRARASRRRRCLKGSRPGARAGSCRRAPSRVRARAERRTGMPSLFHGKGPVASGASFGFSFGRRRSALSAKTRKVPP